jgi:hypothetical protein
MANGRRRRRTAAATTLGALLFGVVAASGGCEIAIGGDVPDFECLQGAAVCPGNEVCDPSSRQCVAPCWMTGCNGGLTCDPRQEICLAGEAGAGGTDATTTDGANPDADAAAAADDRASDEASEHVEAAAAETGLCRGPLCSCSSDASCDSGICALSSTLIAGIYAAAGGGFCTQPCCTSADCGAGTVCFATVSGSTGGSYCVSPAWLQRSASLGTAQGGSSCSVGSDCRSGLCASSACADVCCSTDSDDEPNQCAGGTLCRFSAFPGATSFDTGYAAWCAKESGPNAQNGAACTQNADCQSDLCDRQGNGNCRNACRNTADCGGQGISCAYVLSSSGTGVVTACFPGGGRSTEGSGCATDSDCESQLCDPVSKECADVCFADSDCTPSGWRCRPEDIDLASGGESFTVLVCGT